MEQMLLSSFSELTVHVFRFSTRPGAQKENSNFHFFQPHPIVLNLEIFDTTTQSFEKVLRVEYMKGIIKQLSTFAYELFMSVSLRIRIH